MKSFLFPYYISFGKLDNVDCSIEYSLSEKNAKRLEKSAREGGRFHLNEDPDIDDIFDKVISAIIKQEKQELTLDPSLVIDALSWTDDFDPEAGITEKQIDEYLNDLDIGINYPKELQLLEPSVSKNSRHSKCENVIIEKEIAKDYIRCKENQEKIIYVDDGKTLYYVPPKYSGKFIIDSTVRTFAFEVFLKRNGITEIEIENGIEEIPDWTFSGCEKVERITVPPSVVKIGFNAFTKCYNLKQIELSEGLLEIHHCAFRFCENLKELHIPASVRELDMSITDYHNGLEELFFGGDNTRIIDKYSSSHKRIIIHARKGSQAEQYAMKKRIKYQEMLS